MGIPKRESHTAPAGKRAHGLLMVARGHPELYRTLQQQFGGSQWVTILFDRRRAERRRTLQPVSADLRRMERRAVPHLHDDLGLRKYVLVRPHDRRPRG